MRLPQQNMVPKNLRCMLQIQEKPDTQEHEGLSESLKAIFQHFDVLSCSFSGAVKSSYMESGGRKQKTVGTKETASQLSYKLPESWYSGTPFNFGLLTVGFCS